MKSKTQNRVIKYNIFYLLKLTIQCFLSFLFHMSLFVYIELYTFFMHLVLVLLFLRLYFDVYEYLLGLIIVCTLDELKFDCGHKFKSYSI